MDLTATMDQLVRSIGEMPRELNANACFGTPVAHEGRLVIPVARVGFGGGLGFGGGTGANASPSSNGSERADSGEGGGGGGGGGGSATPLAIIEITRDQVVVQPIRDRTRIELAALAMVAWNAFWFFRTIRAVARARARARV